VGAENPSEPLTWGIREQRFADIGAPRLQFRHLSIPSDVHRTRDAFEEDRRRPRAWESHRPSSGEMDDIFGTHRCHDRSMTLDLASISFNRTSAGGPTLSG
jgi:hypothetical protein